MHAKVNNKQVIYLHSSRYVIHKGTWCSFSWIHGISLRDDGDVSTQCKVDSTEVSARAC